MITDIDEFGEELFAEPILMVTPSMPRRYVNQRVTMTAEVVDISSLNLAKMRCFETL